MTIFIIAFVLAENLENYKKNLKVGIRLNQIDIIYDHVVHKIALKDVAEKYGFNYSTTLNIVRAYQRTGRLFKLLPLHTK